MNGASFLNEACLVVAVRRALLESRILSFGWASLHKVPPPSITITQISCKWYLQKIFDSFSLRATSHRQTVHDVGRVILHIRFALYTAAFETVHASGLVNAVGGVRWCASGNLGPPPDRLASPQERRQCSLVWVSLPLNWLSATTTSLHQLSDCSSCRARIFQAWNDAGKVHGCLSFSEVLLRSNSPIS